MKLKTAKHADKCLCPILELEHQTMWVCERSGSRYSRVSFCDGSFYDDSLLLRPLSSRTEHSRLVEQYSMVSFCDGSFYDDSLLLRPLSSRAKHSRLVVHHCRNSSVLSVLKCASRSFPVCMCFFFFYFSAVLLS